MPLSFPGLISILVIDMDRAFYLPQQHSVNLITCTGNVVIVEAKEQPNFAKIKNVIRA